MAYKFSTFGLSLHKMVHTFFKLRARSFYVHLSWSVCLSVKKIKV